MPYHEESAVHIRICAFFMQNSHNTNILKWLTISKPTDEKKKLFQFGF